MPDSWEQTNGLNISDAADRNLTTLSPAGYTNLEVYLNSLMYPLYAMPGDFNADTKVDAADYVRWRNGMGTTYTSADYNSWRTNFGQTSGIGSGASANPAVPEPATATLIVLAAIGWQLRRRRAATIL